MLKGYAKNVYKYLYTCIVIYRDQFKSCINLFAFLHLLATLYTQNHLRWPLTPLKYY